MYHLYIWPQSHKGAVDETVTADEGHLLWLKGNRVVLEKACKWSLLGLAINCNFFLFVYYKQTENDKYSNSCTVGIFPGEAC